MTYSLSRGSTTVTFNNPQSETINKTSFVETLPIPTEDADKTILIDLNGTVEQITLSGVEVFSSSTDMTTWANSLRSFIQGGQTYVGMSTYTSDVIGSVSVFVEEINIDYQQAEPLVLRYSIRLVRGEGA